MKMVRNWLPKLTKNHRSSAYRESRRIVAFTTFLFVFSDYSTCFNMTIIVGIGYAIAKGIYEEECQSRG